MPDPITANGSAITPDAPVEIAGDGSTATPASPAALAVTGISITPDAPVEISDDGSTSTPAAPEALTSAPAPIRNVYVTGDITNDLLAPSIFPELAPTGTYGGIEQFLNDDLTYGCQFTGSYWTLWDDSVSASWRSLSHAASPELVPSGAWHAVNNPLAWRPYGGSLGTPIVKRYIRPPSPLTPDGSTITPAAPSPIS